MGEAEAVQQNYVRAFKIESVVVILPLPREFSVEKGDVVYVYSKPGKLIVSKQKISDAGLNFLFKRKVQQNNYNVRFIYLPRAFAVLARKDLKYVVSNDYIEFDVSEL